ncbi:chorion peroxidase [Trichonephila clavipes]|nr:chorion peroxidase [Trichonephila clavipes]
MVRLNGIREGYPTSGNLRDRDVVHLQMDVSGDSRGFRHRSESLGKIIQEPRRPEKISLCPSERRITRIRQLSRELYAVPVARIHEKLYTKTCCLRPSHFWTVRLQWCRDWSTYQWVTVLFTQFSLTCDSHFTFTRRDPLPVLSNAREIDSGGGLTIRAGITLDGTPFHVFEKGTFNCCKDQVSEP